MTMSLFACASVTLSAVSGLGTSDGFHRWNVDGNLDAVLDPDDTSGATGEVQMHIDF